MVGKNRTEQKIVKREEIFFLGEAGFEPTPYPMTAWKVENWTAAPSGLVEAKNIQLTVVYKRNTIWVMNLPCCPAALGVPDNRKAP
jgi:hypothetical protein